MLIRWNSWNHFKCKIEEKLIRETGNISIITYERSVFDLLIKLFSKINFDINFLFGYSGCNGVNRTGQTRIQIYKSRWASLADVSVILSAQFLNYAKSSLLFNVVQMTVGLNFEETPRYYYL